MAQFQKGQRPSPNAGRKKGQTSKITEEVRALAKKHGPDAITKLAEIVESPDAENRDKIEAAKVILERAYGKSSPINPEASAGVGGVKIYISGEDAKL